MDKETADRLKSQFLPSSNVDLLRSLIGSSIRRLVRYSWWPPEVAVERLHVSPEQVFSLTLGPLLMQLDDGRVVGFGDIPPFKSVTVWLEQDKHGVVSSHTEDVSDKSSISASDKQFASDTVRACLGKRIISVRILKPHLDEDWRNTRPYEVGVLLECEGANNLLLSHGLYDDKDSFSVITPEQVMEALKPKLYDLHRIEARP